MPQGRTKEATSLKTAGTLRDPALLSDVRQLIAAAREQTARVVNTTLVMMYWHIGRRIQADVLKHERAECGQEILQTLSKELTEEFGRGFGCRNLEQMVRFAEVVPDEGIAQTLSAQLSWSHFTELIRLEDRLKREFYVEMCRVEQWSVRTLRHKIGHLLFERTAFSRKPDDLIEQDITALRDKDRLMPDTVFRDPYILDFLGLPGSHVKKDVEDAILKELEAFILELGTDFAFVARQKRMTIDNEEEGTGGQGSGVGKSVRSPSSGPRSPRGRRLTWRLRWPDEFRDEVPTRLLELNEQRHNEELRLAKQAAQAGNATKSSGGISKGRTKRVNQPSENQSSQRELY